MSTTMLIEGKVPLMNNYQSDGETSSETINDFSQYSDCEGIMPMDKIQQESIPVSQTKTKIPIIMDYSNVIPRTVNNPSKFDGIGCSSESSEEDDSKYDITKKTIIRKIISKTTSVNGVEKESEIQEFLIKDSHHNGMSFNAKKKGGGSTFRSSSAGSNMSYQNKKVGNDTCMETISQKHFGENENCQSGMETNDDLFEETNTEERLLLLSGADSDNDTIIEDCDQNTHETLLKDDISVTSKKLINEENNGFQSQKLLHSPGPTIISTPRQTSSENNDGRKSYLDNATKLNNEDDNLHFSISSTIKKCNDDFNVNDRTHIDYIEESIQVSKVLKLGQTSSSELTKNDDDHNKHTETIEIKWKSPERETEKHQITSVLAREHGDLKINGKALKEIKDKDDIELEKVLNQLNYGVDNNINISRSSKTNTNLISERIFPKHNDKYTRKDETNIISEGNGERKIIINEYRNVFQEGKTKDDNFDKKYERRKSYSPQRYSHGKEYKFVENGLERENKLRLNSRYDYNQSKIGDILNTKRFNVDDVDSRILSGDRIRNTQNESKRKDSQYIKYEDTDDEKNQYYKTQRTGMNIYEDGKKKHRSKSSHLSEINPEERDSRIVKDKNDHNKKYFIKEKFNPSQSINKKKDYNKEEESILQFKDRSDLLRKRNNNFSESFQSWRRSQEFPKKIELNPDPNLKMIKWVDPQKEAHLKYDLKNNLNINRKKSGENKRTFEKETNILTSKEMNNKSTNISIRSKTPIIDDIKEYIIRGNKRQSLNLSRMQLSSPHHKIIAFKEDSTKLSNLKHAEKNSDVYPQSFESMHDYIQSKECACFKIHKPVKLFCSLSIDYNEPENLRRFYSLNNIKDDIYCRSTNTAKILQKFDNQKKYLGESSQSLSYTCANDFAHFCCHCCCVHHYQYGCFCITHSNSKNILFSDQKINKISRQSLNSRKEDSFENLKNTSDILNNEKKPYSVLDKRIFKLEKRLKSLKKDIKEYKISDENSSSESERIVKSQCKNIERQLQLLYESLHKIRGIS